MISKPIIKIIMISFCMVCGMVILMSLYGAIEQSGIGEQTLTVWLTNIPKNFIAALPLQLFIAGPFIRSVLIFYILDKLLKLSNDFIKQSAIIVMFKKLYIILKKYYN